MNELQQKQVILNYCKRNGKITLDDVIKMSIPRNVFSELIKENQLSEVKQGIYQIVKPIKVQNKGLF